MEHCVGCGYSLCRPRLPGAMGIGGEARSFMSTG
jgi:hypothetical protein